MWRCMWPHSALLRVTTLFLSPNQNTLKNYSVNNFSPIAFTALLMKSLKKKQQQQPGGGNHHMTARQTKSITASLSSGWLYRSHSAFDFTVFKILEQPQSLARVLFDGFSSAFNKTQPHFLIERFTSHFMLPVKFDWWSWSYCWSLMTVFFFMGHQSNHGCAFPKFVKCNDNLHD